MAQASQDIAPERPKLTMPAEAAEVVRAAYAKSAVILEYGSGGSTVMAGEMVGKHVTSVESDGDWAQMMRAWFAHNPPASPVEVVHASIGPTRDWGHPKSNQGWRKYAGYPLSVWRMHDFKHPDVVLVDGRFRTGCVLATAFNITRPVTLLFDDYGNRPQYHEIEQFVGSPELIGRLAVFEIAPLPVPADRLLDVIRMITQA